MKDGMDFPRRKLNEMNEEFEKNNFILRCVALNEALVELLLQEPSARVWMSVMERMIKKIINAQENPNRAKKQFIENLDEE